METRDFMNEKVGEDKFTLTITKDEGRTGNFEVTIADKLIWSKKQCSKFPNSDWDQFLEDLKAAMQ